MGIVVDGIAARSALAAHWRPVFEKVSVPDPAALRLLLPHAPDLDLPFEVPSSRTICRYLERAKRSAGGRDGITYQAWLLVGPRAHHSLHRGVHLERRVE